MGVVGLDSNLEELDKAANLVDRVQQENTQLKASFNRLKEWYSELADSQQTLRQQCLQLQQERDDAEHQYLEVCDEWQERLNCKHTVHDAAQCQALTRR
jgi:cell division septum initiation protein DivIVA